MSRKSRSRAKKVQIGNKKLILGKTLDYMNDNNDLYQLNDFVNLRKLLEKQGYLFIRGVIPYEKCMIARKVMLNQANKEGSIKNYNKNDKYPKAFISKIGKKLAEGYCVDGITGSETMERKGIDISAWNIIGPSKELSDVYNGNDLKEFWYNLFGKKSTKALVKQTFLRLMGNSGTIEHADYYYFKRDTHVFNGKDGCNAILAQKEYLKSINEYKKYNFDKIDNLNKEKKYLNIKNNNLLNCSICNKTYNTNEIGKQRLDRLKQNDFGVEGEWHCPYCALSPFGIYTTWMSLSHLSMPNDSILAVCPGSHRLRNWDLPKKNSQIPSDFNWKLKWLIPKQINPGDIIIFNIKTIHAASRNMSKPKQFRCSFDTRLQLYSINYSSNKENINTNNRNSNKKRKKRRRSSYIQLNVQFDSDNENKSDEE